MHLLSIGLGVKVHDIGADLFWGFIIEEGRRIGIPLFMIPEMIRLPELENAYSDGDFCSTVIYSGQCWQLVMVYRS